MGNHIGHPFTVVGILPMLEVEFQCHFYQAASNLIKRLAGGCTIDVGFTQGVVAVKVQPDVVLCAVSIELPQRMVEKIEG